MCVAVFKQCECGSRTVQFHLRDNLLPPEVITRLFCPCCPGDAPYQPEAMVNDNGWIIEYDMKLARMALAAKRQLVAEQVKPEFLFDQGYACWLEMYPGEREEIREEKKRIVELLQKDQQLYLREIHDWNITRIARLKSRGWRKAQLA